MKQIVRRLRICKSPMVVGSLIMALGPAGAGAGTLEVDFDSDNFVPGAQIDNMYWPLIAGTSFVYYAESEDGCEANRIRVLAGPLKDDFNAPYGDIAAWQIEDKAYVSEECDGQFALVEDTIDWFAQDKDGNVWYFGEDTTAYDHDDECPSSSGAWEAGADTAGIGSNADAGIIMLAEPEDGLAYQQEYYEGEAEDWGKVAKTDDSVSIDMGDYEGCLKTKEWTPLERGAVEFKFYCPPIGEVLVNEQKGKTLRVELVGDSLDDVPVPDGVAMNTFAAAGVCPP